MAHLTLKIVCCVVVAFAGVAVAFPVGEVRDADVIGEGDLGLPAETSTEITSDLLEPETHEETMLGTASAPEIPSSDTSAPDIPASDTSAPDISSSDISSSDTSASDTSAPDIPASDTSAPDISALETSAADISATDASASSPDTSASSADTTVASESISETSASASDSASSTAATTTGTSEKEETTTSESETSASQTTETSTSATTTSPSPSSSSSTTIATTTTPTTRSSTTRRAKMFQRTFVKPAARHAEEDPEDADQSRTSAISHSHSKRGSEASKLSYSRNAPLNMRALCKYSIEMDSVPHLRYRENVEYAKLLSSDKCVSAYGQDYGCEPVMRDIMVYRRRPQYSGNIVSYTAWYETTEPFPVAFVCARK